MRPSLLDRLVLAWRAQPRDSQSPRGSRADAGARLPLPALLLVASVPFSCWAGAGWLTHQAERETRALHAKAQVPAARAVREQAILARLAAGPRVVERLDRIAAALGPEERLRSVSGNAAGQLRISLMTPDPAASRDRFERQGLGRWRTLAERRGEGVMIVERQSP